MLLKHQHVELDLTTEKRFMPTHEHSPHGEPIWHCVWRMGHKVTRTWLMQWLGLKCLMLIFENNQGSHFLNLWPPHFIAVNQGSCVPSMWSREPRKNKCYKSSNILGLFDLALRGTIWSVEMGLRVARLRWNPFWLSSSWGWNQGIYSVSLDSCKCFKI